jgi:RimJ/RimL family protein N-acetyltransferase
MAELVLYDRQRVGDWVARRVLQTGSWGDFNAFGVEMNDELVAGVVIHNINGANAFCHIAISKPCKAMYDLFFVVCDYCFRQLELKRITGMVPTDEQKTIDFDLRLGFYKEFVMKDAAPGADMQVLVMWADDCPWLERNKNGR